MLPLSVALLSVSAILLQSSIAAAEPAKPARRYSNAATMIDLGSRNAEQLPRETAIVGTLGLTAPPPKPAASGRIAFDSFRDGNYEIYVMDANGANQTRLTNNPAIDSHPAWSPDGTKIIFSSNRTGDEIYVMDANGSNQINLTNNPAQDFTSAWSPDGTKIAFTSIRDGNEDIYLMDSDGSNQMRLTSDPGNDEFPAWSPDGTKIVFETNRDHSFYYQLYIMDANGTNQLRLTNSPSTDTDPAWSPDGTKIAFASDRTNNYDIYVMDANGTHLVRLTKNVEGQRHPTWSPDGSKIAYHEDGAIYVMDTDGSNVIMLSNNSNFDSNPTWQRTPPPPTPTPAATPTPGPSSGKALNISTRMRVDTGSNVLIGGFIITGTADKTVAVRGIGPSLGAFGVPDALADPTLELRDGNNAVVFANDDWQSDPDQASQLTSLNLGLQDPKESGLVITMQPGSYTAVLAGKNQTIGVSLVEIYDTSAASASELANISTRGFVLTESNVMIGGFILGGSNNSHVAVRGIGPSLAQFGIPNVLADPTLELHDANGVTLISNDNWQDDSISAGQLAALGLGLKETAESGIYTSLAPGAFTAVLAGRSNATGVGLLEIYNFH